MTFKKWILRKHLASLDKTTDIVNQVHQLAQQRNSHGDIRFAISEYLVEVLLDEIGFEGPEVLSILRENGLAS